MIYLDSAATSFPKPEGMYGAMEECLKYYCGNPGRSGHTFSIKTGEMVYETRKNLAEFFHIKNPERVIFTKNTTEALNIAILGYLKNGDHVVTSSMEHNSILRPLKILESKGISHTIVKADSEGSISVKKLEKAIKPNTRLIAITGASNVTGTKMDISDIGRLAQRRGVRFLLDAAQCAGSIPVNVNEINCDFMAFAGHKGLLGPQGTGGLYISPEVNINPLLYGGTGTESRSRLQPLDMPEAFEAGTINAPGIIGLGYALKVIDKIGIDAIEFYEKQLTRQLDEALFNMDEVIMYGPDADRKTGISLFNLKEKDCEEVAERLNREYGIAVRSGYHCAGLAHKTIGTWNCGAIRVSVGPFNTRKEINRTIDAIWHIGKGK